MKKLMVILFITACLMAMGAAYAVSVMEDIKEHPACAYCGMDRGKFAMSRMLTEYLDGAVTATCSLHCAALDLAVNIGRTPDRIMAADYNTGELIAAEKALWVLGGQKPGIMTGRAKWAFRDEGSARAFMEENGGMPVKFEDAMEAAYEDMYHDTKMLRMKRQKMKEMKEKAE